MKLDYDNRRTRNTAAIGAASDIDQKTPLQLFEEFYVGQNDLPLSEQQRSFLQTMIEKIWEGAE